MTPQTQIDPKRVLEMLNTLNAMPTWLSGGDCGGPDKLVKFEIKDNVAYDKNGNPFFPVMMDGSKPNPHVDSWQKWGHPVVTPDGTYYGYLINKKIEFSADTVKEWRSKKPIVHKSRSKSQKERDFWANYSAKNIAEHEQMLQRTIGWEDFATEFPVSFPCYSIRHKVCQDLEFKPQVSELWLDRYDMNIYHNEYPYHETIMEVNCSKCFSSILLAESMSGWDRRYCPWYSLSYYFTAKLDMLGAAFMAEYQNRDNWNLYNEYENERAKAKPNLVNAMNSLIDEIWASDISDIEIPSDY